jgi:hypothetical protein
MKVNDNDDDDAPTADELAEAEALARALDPAVPAAPGGRPAPEDALATAALLRHARQLGAAAAPAHAGAAAARALAARGGTRRWWQWRWRWQWMVPTFAVPAVALVVLISNVRGVRSSRPATPLPAPAFTLLEAQAQAARGHTDLAALDQQMREYRSALYGALATREGGGR